MKNYENEIDMSLIPLSKQDADLVPFKVGDAVIIAPSKIFYDGLRGQQAKIVSIGYDFHSGMKMARVMAKDHKVPNYPANFEWEIVIELLELIK